MFIYLDYIKFNSVQSLSRVWLFAAPWTAECQASLSITNSQSLPKPMSIESVMPSNHLSSVTPFSCPQSFPAAGSFQMSQLFTSGGQSTRDSASASVLPMNIQDLFPSLFTLMHWRRKWQPTPVFLPGESQSLVGCCLWGRTESDTTEATQQQQQQQHLGSTASKLKLISPHNCGKTLLRIFGIMNDEVF